MPSAFETFFSLSLMVKVLAKDRSHLSREASWRLRRAFTLAEAMSLKELCLERLAEASGLSLGHISRMFHLVAGCSFEDYCHHRRFGEAKRLLVETALAVKEVADQVGCCDVDRFAQKFERETGFKPSSYRDYYWRYGRTPSGRAKKKRRL